MKTFSIQLLFLFLLAFEANSFEVKPFDSASLLGIYTRSKTFNTIRLDATLPPFSEEAGVDKRITLSVFFEEQCAIKCLRNVNCVRYSFLNQQTCHIFLKANYKRQSVYQKKQTDDLEKVLGCNLQSCSNGFYCSESVGTCLCPAPDVFCYGKSCLFHALQASDKTCSSRVSYEMSEWSEWSNCSAQCDEGYQTRSRKCQRTYFDSATNSTVRVEPVEGMDWLCGNVTKYQSNTCKINSCKNYGDWSSWSTCSKICGGSISRQRRCQPNKNCDFKFLKQTKLCGLSECNSVIIKLERTDQVPENTIIKRGMLKMIETEKSRPIRVFTHSNEKNDLLNIGRVACREFNFDNVNDAIGLAVNNLRSQFSSDQDYLNFINEESLNGVTCEGNEDTVKDCVYKPTATLKTNLYEIEVECLYNGYWSAWDSWSDCSVTCGAGAKRRFRMCTDPPASIAELSTAINGSTCNEANNKQLMTCVKPRCESQVSF